MSGAQEEKPREETERGEMEVNGGKMLQRRPIDSTLVGSGQERRRVGRLHREQTA
jgi:hypothetical protein